MLRHPAPAGLGPAPSVGGQEALEVIKWRDVYHALEETIDAAEDAGEVMERMLHKGA